jgi:hypothetical protein
LNRPTTRQIGGTLKWANGAQFLHWPNQCQRGSTWKPKKCRRVFIRQCCCYWKGPEAILAAFQEEKWTARIDDPLPPVPEQDSKRRLSDTITCLNRNQKHQLIRFHGDGTGEGIIWEFIGQNG